MHLPPYCPIFKGQKLLFTFLFSSPPPQNKFLQNSFSTESFPLLCIQLHIWAGEEQRTACYSPTPCVILNAPFPYIKISPPYWWLSFLSSTLLWAFLSFFFPLPIPIFPRTSYVRAPSPTHCPPLPIPQNRAAPFPGFLQRSGTPHNCKYLHSYQSQPGCNHQEEEEKLGESQTHNRTI